MSCPAPLKAMALAAALVLTALPAAAQCYADFRVRDRNWDIRFGVSQVPNTACGDTSAAHRHIEPRVQRDGWILLDVLSTFGPEGLETRRANAGDLFLRY